MTDQGRVVPDEGSSTSESMQERKAKPGGSKTPWTFPRHTLEEAIEIAKAIEEKNGGNPFPAEDLAKAVGYNKVADWRFLDLLKSANQYGLCEGSGTTAKVRMLDIGQDIVAPGSPIQRQQALVRAFRNVPDFEKVEQYYRGKKLPEDEFFENTLAREFSLPRDRITAFIRVFTENLGYLKAFKADPTASEGNRLPSVAAPETGLTQETEHTGRTFLDTCFVMMPFGPWFDAYYKDIYAPAIKDAGFEPMRADELFNAGTVIEQIWEHIEKSKVLLADLSGKNPNVFYELGLAHAARKPVVFTSNNIEDIPFDLRHLRVIVYDIRDPSWGEKLRKSITTYLKNAKAEPAKSIPQPFRGMTSNTDKDTE